MTEVLFVKPGTIRPTDKRKLGKAGVVVVEVENPGDAKFVTPSMEGGNLPGGDLLTALARGVLRLKGADWAVAYFAEEVATAIILADERQRVHQNQPVNPNVTQEGEQ